MTTTSSPRLPRLLPLPLLLACACGDPTQGADTASTSNEPQGTDASSSDAGATTATMADDDTDTEAATTSTSADSTGAGTEVGTTGSDGRDDDVDESGPDSESGVEPLVCGRQQARFVGTIDGTALDGAFDASGAFASFAGDRVLDFGTSGVLHVYADEGSGADAVLGHLRMPDESALAGQWFCAGDGSTLDVQEKPFTVDGELAMIAPLGNCPGAPVEGAVVVCIGDAACGGGYDVVSTVADAGFALPLESLVAVGSSATDETELRGYFGDTHGGFAALYAVDVDDGPGASSATIEHGYFMVPVGQPDEGAVYCVSGSADFVGGSLVRAELTEISRVGSCAATVGDDALEMCFAM